jgi:hypothetical protein
MSAMIGAELLHSVVDLRQEQRQVLVEVRCRESGSASVFRAVGV